MSEPALADNDLLSEAIFAPEEKFANPRDHLGRTAVEVRRLCKQAVDCKCPICLHGLILKAGEKMPVHFAHAVGRKDTACRGGFETPWHLAAKRAAATREGWLAEFTDGEWRYDACNQWTGQVFEAVHSISPTYVAKQRYLRSLGRPAVWLFDSAGHFASRGSEVRIDLDKAFVGILRCNDLLKPKAADLVDELGRECCFVHYLGLAWECIGRDQWKCCTSLSDMQRLCVGEHGLNRNLIHMRASGVYPGDTQWFRNGELVSSSWQEISPGNLSVTVRLHYSQLFEEWLRGKNARERQRRRTASSQYRPTTLSDLAGKSQPVCRLAKSQAGLTAEQVRSLDAACDLLATPAIETKPQASSSSDHDCCRNGHKPIATNNDWRGWVRFECKVCGRWLGYAPPR